MLGRDPRTGDLECLIQCYDGCSYVGLTHFHDEPDPPVLYGEFYVGASAPSMRWWGRYGRFAAIWKLLRCREHLLADVVLAREGAWELRDFLEATLGSRAETGEGR